ncbi:MAG: hypothetical protein JNM79_16415 [Burkholderiales bacterium]|nr:hypothetical protein [Burkholderiales bacterium]
MGLSRGSGVGLSLVLIGVGGWFAQSDRVPDPNLRQDLYATREECQVDWGPAEEDCQPGSADGVTSTGRSGRSTFYYGRPYHPGDTGAAPRSTRAVGSTTTSRGGFGGSGRAVSSGGG